MPGKASFLSSGLTAIVCRLQKCVHSSVFQGDSGGPLIIQRESKQHEIVGVVSWGKHIDNDTQSTNWLFLKNFGSKTLFIHTFHTQVLAVPDQIIPASIRE